MFGKVSYPNSSVLSTKIMVDTETHKKNCDSLSQPVPSGFGKMFCGHYSYLGWEHLGGFYVDTQSNKGRNYHHTISLGQIICGHDKFMLLLLKK